MGVDPAPRAPLPAYLKVSVFLAGLAVMGAEMAAPRLLAPSFGSSQIIWTNIIGTVLASLTVGAWLGGRCADRWPTERAYASVLGLAGGLLALVPLLSRPLLDAAARALAAQQAGTFLLSLVAVCLFFAPATLLLGMIGPWALRLAGAGRSDLGHVAGVLSGLSAAGSILGTFLASFAALPLLGTAKTLLAVAALLLATGAWRALPSPAPRAAAALAALLLPALPTGAVRWTRGTLFEAESVYQYLEVREDSDGPAPGTRRLFLCEGQGSHSVLPPSGVLTGAYWDWMSVVPALRASRGPELRVLIVGLAGGTVARQIDHYYGAAQRLRIDGVEIDPAVLEAGRRWFRMDEIPTLSAHAADGRAFLAVTERRFDVILVDAFRQPYIPFHLATREFYELCRSRLAPGGVLALNVGAAEEAKALIDGFTATLGAVFPHVARSHYENRDLPFRNYIYVAADHALQPPTALAVPKELRWEALAGMRRTWTTPTAPKGSVFTDDLAPVELLTDQMILGIAKRP